MSQDSADRRFQSDRDSGDGRRAPAEQLEMSSSGHAMIKFVNDD